MAKFIYTGKKIGYKFGDVYEHKDEINPGDVFELTGNDLILMKRCISISKAQGEETQTFVPKDLHDLENAKEEVVEAPQASVYPELPKEPVKKRRGRKPKQ